jgi:hypothetical protein
MGDAVGPHDDIPGGAPRRGAPPATRGPLGRVLLVVGVVLGVLLLAAGA